MEKIVAVCPRCGSDQLFAEEPDEIVFKCITRIKFICKNCGLEGFIKIYNNEGKKVEIDIE